MHIEIVIFVILDMVVIIEFNERKVKQGGDIMYIEIKALSEDAYSNMLDDCGIRLFTSASNFHDNVCDVTISRDAIVKVNGETIWFDLGGRKTDINRIEFHEITIH